MVARIMTEEEMADFSGELVGDDVMKLSAMLTRLTILTEQKLKIIKSQENTIGKEGVKVFSDTINKHSAQWSRDLAMYSVSAANELLTDFETESVSNLVDYIPETRGGNLKLSSLTKEQREAVLREDEIIKMQTAK